MSSLDQHIEAVAAWSRALRRAEAEAEDARRVWGAATAHEDDMRRELLSAQRALLEAIAQDAAEVTR